MFGGGFSLTDRESMDLLDLQISKPPVFKLDSESLTLELTNNSDHPIFQIVARLRIISEKAKRGVARGDVISEFPNRLGAHESLTIDEDSIDYAILQYLPKLQEGDYMLYEVLYVSADRERFKTNLEPMRVELTGKVKPPAAPRSFPKLHTLQELQDENRRRNPGQPEVKVEGWK
jgi:hypothetical protein